MRLTKSLFVAGVLALSMMAQVALAAYPEKPITVIVPFGAGSNADRLLRLALPYMKDALGVDLVLDYKDGGGGVVGSNYFMTTKNDGYTLLFYNQPHITIQSRFQKTAYKTEYLEPVLGMNWRPEIITVKKDSPFKTIEEFVAYAKANPGKLTVGNTGSFSSNHLTFSLISKLLGIKMTRVPFDSGAKMNAALLGGQIDACISNMTWLAIYPDDLRVLVSTEKSRPQPEIPTFLEMGFKELVDISAINIVYVRKDAPAEAVKFLTEKLGTLTSNEQFKADLTKEGYEGIFNAKEVTEITTMFTTQIDLVEKEMPKD